MASIKPIRTLGPRQSANPEIPAAGTNRKVENASAKDCFRWDNNIPEKHISIRFDKSHDKIKNMTHGMLLERKDTTKEVLMPDYGKNPLISEFESYRERNYNRKESQPLGKPPASLIVLPAYTDEKNYKFGKVSHKDESVRSIIYPPIKPDEDPIIAKQYAISHGSTKPGEQKRHYGPNWTAPEYLQTVESKRLSQDGGVQAALYWHEKRRIDLHNKVITLGLAEFQECHQKEIGKVFDPLKDTRTNLPKDYTFGVTGDAGNMHVRDLIGTEPPVVQKQNYKNNEERPPAGKCFGHYDDLDLQKNIVPTLRPQEDSKLVRKITEDKIGGINPRKRLDFDSLRVFGIPTVRDPSEHSYGLRSLADKNNYGDELGAKGLMYPTPINVYGREQLKYLEQQLMQVSL